MDQTIRPAEALRLEQARLDRGFKTAKEAATYFGWNYNTYSQHERGERGLTKAAAARYGKAYRTSPGWLLTGEQPDSEIERVPLLSWVSAGRLADATSQVPVEDVPLLAFADLGPGEFFALRVQGDSMDRLSPDGSIILVNRADRQLVGGKPYVFSVRGEATYKLWRPDPPRLAPFTTNPLLDAIYVDRQPVEVVGRVKRTLLDL